MSSTLSPTPAPAGVFISFEGIDGAGKSSHIDALAAAFRAQGRTVTLTREPGGTPLAEKLRALLLNDAMDGLTESLLVFAARRDHQQGVIVPARARGDVVICDRFTDATFAYQGGGRGFDLAQLASLERMVQTGLRADAPGALLEPALTLWFDLPPAVAAERLVAARTPDRFEAEPRAFFERVAAAYAARAQGAPARFARVDAAASRDGVWHAVRAACVARGWLAAEEVAAP